jgi:hypothetical protein
MRLASTVDTKQLGPEEAQELQQLVENADFFGLPSTITTKDLQPDRFEYKLTVEDDKGHKHTITVGETAIPPSVKPLADWLTEYARRR